MRSIVLILAWVTPALIAGGLGWTGVWGAGSALGDYLVPIPVAGGVMHVPSFLVATLLTFATRDPEAPFVRYLPLLAFATMTAAISLSLDFDRLNSWFFTDYEPHGSPLRFEGNPLMLFVATDAFWVGLYAWAKGARTPSRYWLALPAVPIAIVAAGAVTYQSSGPVFEYGGSMSTTVRGNMITLVYTPEPYDEELFLNWLTQEGLLLEPWMTPNAEHVAVVFTHSKQFVEWRRFDAIEEAGAVGTICAYEEDRSIVAHEGYYDCFAERNTVEEDLAELAVSKSTGLGSDIDQWYARVRLCDDVEVPEEGGLDIERIGVCRGMVRVHPKNVRQFVAKYGESSEQLSFVRSEAASRGLSE